MNIKQANELLNYHAKDQELGHFDAKGWDQLLEQVTAKLGGQRIGLTLRTIGDALGELYVKSHGRDIGFLIQTTVELQDRLLVIASRYGEPPKPVKKVMIPAKLAYPAHGIISALDGELTRRIHLNRRPAIPRHLEASVNVDDDGEYVHGSQVSTSQKIFDGLVSQDVAAMKLFADLMIAEPAREEWR